MGDHTWIQAPSIIMIQCGNSVMKCNSKRTKECHKSQYFSSILVESSGRQFQQSGEIFAFGPTCYLMPFLTTGLEEARGLVSTFRKDLSNSHKGGRLDTAVDNE